MKLNKSIIFTIIAIFITLSWLYFFIWEKKINDTGKNKNYDKNINFEKEKNIYINKNITIRKNGIREYKKWAVEVKELNNIVRFAKKIEDIKKCDSILDLALKNVCISRVKAKIKDYNNVDKEKGCDNFNEKERNICLLNFYIKTIKEDSYKEKCLNITDKNLKNICTSRIKNNLLNN